MWEGAGKLKDFIPHSHACSVKRQVGASAEESGRTDAVGHDGSLGPSLQAGEIGGRGGDRAETQKSLLARGRRSSRGAGAEMVRALGSLL